jgi:hypothetical protein
MPLPHIVQQTVGVGIETCCHDSFLQRSAGSVRGVSPSRGARPRRANIHEVTTRRSDDASFGITPL